MTSCFYDILPCRGGFVLVQHCCDFVVYEEFRRTSALHPWLSQFLWLSPLEVTVSWGVLMCALHACGWVPNGGCGWLLSG